MDEREEQTLGKKEKAVQMRRNAEGMIEKYRKSIEETRLKAVREREMKGLKADEEEQRQIQKARDQARVNFSNSVKQIEKDFLEARTELQASIEPLAAEIVDQVLSGSQETSKSMHSADTAT